VVWLEQRGGEHTAPHGRKKGIEDALSMHNA
jgi:hypothetical protein